MNGRVRATHDQPGGFIDSTTDSEDGVVNDSLGTVDTADSNGLDEDKETGEAKTQNKDTHED